jgi:hypothetical protein
MHDPSEIPGRKGVPFRWWRPHVGATKSVWEEYRRELTGEAGGLLIFHSTPNWASRFAKAFHLPYYSFLPSILAHYLRDLPGPITVASVNDGNLLPSLAHPTIRILNLGSLTQSDYESLLLASDLMITENAVSVGLARAIHYLRPCAVIRNSYSLAQLLEQADQPIRRFLLDMEGVKAGSVFPYEVFPIWGQQELEELGLFRHNSAAQAFAHIEIFGGPSTQKMLQGLLTNEAMRGELQSAQQTYLRGLGSLWDPDQALRNLAEP